ncbi:MAG TPA: MFS transporter [Dehalococcoidia bacterium]|nr:MFS transporter [Dehalococcoidia bacterium]
MTFASAMHVFSDLCFALLVPLQLVMQKDLGLSYFQVGLLRTMFNGSTAILQIPAGIMAERVGEFWLLVLGNAWVSVGLMGMALSPVFIALLLVGFIGGLGGGTQHPLGSSLVSRAYEDRGRSTAVGTVNFAGDLGKILAPLVALIAIPFGWRAVLWVVGIGGLLLMALSIPLRSSVDIGKPLPKEESNATDSGNGGSLGGFVMLSVVGFLDSATRGASLVFLPFVMDARGMGPGQISLMLVLLFSGGALGKYVVGWLGDRFETVTLIWATKGLTAALLMLSLVTPALGLAPLMVVLGIGLNGTSSALYAGVAYLIPARRRARLYGFFYTTNEGGTVLAPLLYGVIADGFSLNVTVVVMGMVTMMILPVSLALRRHLSPAARGA